ncbi:MAG: hypothetical protein JXA71_07900 [Chitinispirillaceae bacterium]|nr:hypothetical protein [Chitinispirillaceae bacterium]
MHEHSSFNHVPGAAGRGAKVTKIFGLVVGGVALAVLFALAFGWLVMLLWNWLMPALFGLKTITYWQGFGMLVLAKLLFGAIGSHKHTYDHAHKYAKGYGTMKKWIEACGGLEACTPGGEPENWRYYADYWRTEGKAAFERYLERMKKDSAAAVGD